MLLSHTSLGKGARMLACRVARTAPFHGHLLFSKVYIGTQNLKINSLPIPFRLDYHPPRREMFLHTYNTYRHRHLILHIVSHVLPQIRYSQMMTQTRTMALAAI
jgi:hypothetical protein